jgi:hypothetical protein
VRRALCGVGLVVVLAGCAEVPTSGSVHVGRALLPVAGPDAEDIRAFPSGPLVGLTPVGIVTGYLDALVDSDGNYSIARAFLAPGTSWNSTSDITLYDENTQVVTRESPQLVNVEMNRVGVVDPRGAYKVDPGSIDVRFRVIRRSGQWRISHLPPGVLLSASDAQRSLQTASVYYLNHAQTRVVPTPILVPPDQPGLATTLITTLFAGPPRALTPGVTSAVPSGTQLLGNVPIDDGGAAEVDLSGRVQQLSTSELQRLSAQIVWTLRQVPTVTAVRLLDNGTPLSDAAVPELQPVGSWSQFDPDTPPVSDGVLLARNGHIAGLDRAVPTALGRRDLQHPAVSADGSTVAALLREGARMTLLVGPATGSMTPRLSSVRLSPPAFDPDGDVLLVSSSGARSSVMLVPRHGAPRRVTVPRELEISQLAISPDGSRVALVVGPSGRQSLAVGVMSTAHGTDLISETATVVPPADDVQGVAWVGANEIATTVRESESRRAVLETSVDGYRPHVVSSAGLPRNPTQVAAAPRQPILAAAGDAVWLLSDRRWQRVSTGRDPSYAG